MKTKLFNSVIALLAAILISSCGGSGAGFSSSSNEYLNYLPSIAKDYTQKIEDKEKAIHENTSLDNAFKLEKELDLLKEEWAAKIKESNTANPLTKPLPFDALPDMPYTINKIRIDNDKVYKANITMVFDVIINKDIKNTYGSFEKSMFVYYTALDKKGDEIPRTASVAAAYSNRAELKAGVNLNLSAQLSPLANLEDFAKIKIITKEEYDESKKKK